ncbi:MAG: type I secretion system permease/ATPase [Sulfurimonas sp.]|jgi:PrtD family type I secretion system ABC transporter
MSFSLRSYMNRPVLRTIHQPSIWIVAVLTFLLNISMLAIPLYILQVYDRVLLSRSLETLMLLWVGVAFVIVFNGFVERTRGSVLVRVANRFELGLSRLLFDIGMHDAAYSNKVSLQFTSDLRQVKQFLTAENGLAIFLEIPWSIMYVIILFFAHPLLGFSSLFFVLVLLFMTLAEESLTTRSIEASQESTMEANQKMSELLMGAQTIEAMGMRSSVRKVWETISLRAMADGSQANEVISATQSGMKFMRLIQTISMTAVGAYLAMSAQITIGAMIVAGLLAAKGTAPLEMFISGLKNFKLTLKSINELNAQLDGYKREENKMTLPDPKGKIVFERVVYAPPSSDVTIIKGITFGIEAGTFLGVIGASGSGKSTLAKLMAGLYAPYSGIIRIDEADIQMYQRERLGQHLGYLPQEVVLFEGNIKDNIARFTDASDEEILRAAQLAGAHEMILHLPKGYETQVGSRGMNLSGGQRQRIGLARALFGSPRIIILDEPNSALDHEAEQKLLGALVTLKGEGVTIVVITHKPSLLIQADKLLVLHEGTIQQFGNNAQVAENYKEIK